MFGPKRLFRQIFHERLVNTGSMSHAATATDHADLIARLKSENPILADGSADDFAKINALRQWTFDNVPMPLDRAAGLDGENSKCHWWPLEELIAALDADKGGFWSAGTARTFCRLCELFGYSTAVIQIGESSGPNNHFVVLVQFQSDDQTIVVVADPYFNYSVAWQDGTPADTRAIVSAIERRDTGVFRFIGPASKHKARTLRSAPGRPGTFLREKIPYQWYAGSALKEWLIEQTNGLNPLYLLAFPLGIATYGPHSQELHDVFAALKSLKLARPKTDPEVLRRLYLCKSDADFEAAVSSLSVEIIRDLFGDDFWLQNRLVGMREFQLGLSKLTSYPIDINIPIADICNARCSFCTSWLEGKRLLKLSEIDAFEDVIRHASAVGLAGHGEPLSHPKLTDILDRLAAWLDPRARCYVISNAVYLEQNIDRLLAARVTAYAISLNAATAATHETVMGLEHGSFDRILDGIRKLLARRSAETPISVTISLVLTQQNIAEVADFVRLGNELGVDGIQLKTLAGAGGSITGLNYHLLPPYLHPDYKRHKEAALAAIAESKVQIIGDPASWDTAIFPEAVEREFAQNPPKTMERRDALHDPTVREFYSAQKKYSAPTRGELVARLDDSDGMNPYGRRPRFACKAPYKHLYLNDFSYNVSPCCYMSHVPGHHPIIYDGSYDFFEAWNSPAMQVLRERLRDGPLFRMCSRCPAVY